MFRKKQHTEAPGISEETHQAVVEELAQLKQYVQQK